MKRVLLAIFLTGCATYHDELMRGQASFEKSENEQALAILRALEHDQSHFDQSERARYAYLRGMSDFRMGYRADARHWLAVAKETDDKGGKLPDDWKKKCEAALAELNEPVWSGGMMALDKPAEKPKEKRRDPEDKPKAKEEE